MSKRLANKVLVIGWDAADWKVINPLMDAGYMPALESLVNRGVIGNISTLDPPLSPMLWTSIATSKTADQHGILGFIQPDPEQNRLRPVLGSSRKVKAVWNILNQEGFRSHVIGWWPSHPAEPINGVSVTNFYHQASRKYGEEWPLAEGTVYPERLRSILGQLRVHPAELTAAHLLPFVPNAAKLPEGDVRLVQLARIIADCASVHAAATYAMEHEEWDFMAVYYDAIDHFSHGWMRYHPPKQEWVDDEMYEMFNYVVQAGYRFHDMMLERMLQLAGPDTTVILLSDHGFHSDHLRPRGFPKIPAGPAIEHRDLGVICMAGPHIRPDERIYGSGLLDICPTILTLFGLPIGKDMRGKPLVQAFDHKVAPTYIDSWELVDGDSGMLPVDERADPWAEQQMMNQLAELGYIDRSDDNVQATVDEYMRESNYYLARVHMQNQNHGEAAAILEQLCVDAPDATRFQIWLVDCYQKLGRYDKSRQLLDQLKEVENAGNRNLTLMEGIQLLAEEKLPEALDVLQSAQEATPNRPVLFLHIGQIYIKMKEWQLAAEAFTQALAIDPDSVAGHSGMAISKYHLGEYEDAADAALASIGILYFQPNMHFVFGNILVKLGYLAQAIDAFTVSAAQAPTSFRPHKRLADVYVALDDPESAAHHRAEAERLSAVN